MAINSGVDENDWDDRIEECRLKFEETENPLYIFSAIEMNFHRAGIRLDRTRPGELHPVPAWISLPKGLLPLGSSSLVHATRLRSVYPPTPTESDLVG